MMARPVRVAHVAGVDLTHRFLLLRQLSYLRDRGYDVTAISASGPHLAEIEAAGIRHVAWPHITRAWDPRSDILALRELVRILRRERFDIVHTHNPKPGVMGRLAARITGVPCIVNTVHGLYAMPEDRWQKRGAVLAVEAVASRLSHFELYQSEEDLRWARRRRVTSRRRSELLGNGTNLEEFSPSAVSLARRRELRRELGIPSEALVVGAVGRLVVEKGYRELLEAARRINATVPEARFLVVGAPDADKADAITEAEIAGAGENVVFVGWRSDVRDLLGATDVFVLASWREGVPRSVIEAAAMGKPLVVTDIRGCREVVRDRREGLLVPPRDVDRLTSAVELLLGDPSLREAMGSAARLRVERRFDENCVLDRLAATYDRLLGARGVAVATPPGIKIRAARSSDDAALADLHQRSLPEAFLPALGERFMRRLYRALVADPEAIVLVAEEASRVVGFVAGVRSVPCFYRRFFRRHAVAAGLAAAPRLLRGSTLRRAYETARYPVSGTRLPDAELLAVAVSSRSRRSGVGRDLVERLLRGLNEMGVEQVKVVVASSNDPANRFYDRIGFQKATTIAVHEGTSSNVWIYECHSSLRSA